MKVEFKTSQGQFAFLKDNGTLKFIITKKGVVINGKKVKPIGFVKDLTEEQWSEIVDGYASCGVPDFMNYITNEGCTATESGKSLMDSLEVYTKNPIEKPISVYYTSVFSLEKNPQETYRSDLHEYEKAQGRTGNWLLIKYNND